jgi:predicted amidohydrolase
MKPVRICLAITKSKAGKFAENLEICLDAIQKAGRKKADMVVFPEMNLTGYAGDHQIYAMARTIDKDLIQPFIQISHQLHMIILVGLAEKTDSGQIYASHLIFLPNAPYGKYRKIHTAPNEQDIFTAGNSIPVFEHPKIRFGVQLCYDAHFPELSTTMALQQVDLIVFPHASPRGSTAQKFASWMRHLPARAFDNGIFIAAVNQIADNGAGLCFPGLSVVIGPDGNLISRCMDQENHLHTVDLDPEMLTHVRSHRMRYFLPFRRNDLFPATL